MKITIRLNDKGLVRDIEKDDSKWDWIETARQLKLQLPPLPRGLEPLVNRYKPGDAITKDMEIIPPSGQFWSQLTDTEKTKLLELIEWTGQSAEEYCRHFQSMLPRDPRRR